MTPRKSETKQRTLDSKMADDSKKNFICNEAMHLAEADYIHILRLIKSYDSTKLKRCSDGTRVNLNTLPENIVDQIYEYIKRKQKITSD